eukprot:jgi/Undpi1/4840/HiC_scaffold_19.g08193.m1
MASAGTPTLQYGYPTPGPQDPTGQTVMESEFFLSNEQWENARGNNSYDLVIIGTGFCGLAVATRALEINPATRILMIERGTFFLPEHFQNLPPATAGTLRGMSETFPWTLAHETATGKDGLVRWSHGMVPFLGGRSTVWSAWCPVPNREEMKGWPDETIKAAEDQMLKASELLNVQSVSDVDSNRTAEVLRLCNITSPVYGTLQAHLDRLLKGELVKTVGSIYRVEPAPIASASNNGVDFHKFSTPGPLLELATKNNVDIVTGCAVRRIVRQGRVSTALETSRGVLPLGDAKLVLAMGALPPVTLIHNSFPELTARRMELDAAVEAPSADTCPRVGERFSGHFITSIVARVPRENFISSITGKPIPFADLEVGAFYAAGTVLGTDNKRDYGKQFHIQLTALADKDPAENGPKASGSCNFPHYCVAIEKYHGRDEAMRYMPDVVATASEAQLSSSKDFVVYVCAVLGEMDASTTQNRFLANPADPDPTTNSVLRMVTSGKADEATWQTMDDATFEMLENVLSPAHNPGEASKVKYWHGTPDVGEWLAQRPPVAQYRVDAIVHESSTLHVGAASDAPVDLNYQLKGTENVFVTGGGLWPRGGSWNPTLTMAALALDLADKLVSLNVCILGYVSFLWTR